jgi:hypothetical protein
MAKPAFDEPSPLFARRSVCGVPLLSRFGNGEGSLAVDVPVDYGDLDDALSNHRLRNRGRDRDRRV